MVLVFTTPEEVGSATFDRVDTAGGATAELLIAEDLVFDSPQDDCIDRHSFFERSFPT
jgi:hypothetical protein